MIDSTKDGAYEKISYLVRNIAYPDGILDDAWLEKYYAMLKYSLTDDYLTILTRINEFMGYTSFQVLTITSGSIRDDFGGPPSIVNAWYQPEMNSITFPLGILQQPFYDIDYPAAINFGAMGVVAGHELTHGK
jgi:predicted metalloendopeptidase